MDNLPTDTETPQFDLLTGILSLVGNSIPKHFLSVTIKRLSESDLTAGSIQMVEPLVDNYYSRGFSLKTLIIPLGHPFMVQNILTCHPLITINY